MSEGVDKELLEFAGELLEEHGGVVEKQSDSLLALLPPSLARELDLPDEARLGGEEAPLLYGSPILDRLVHFAVKDIPVVYGTIPVSYLKKGGFDQLLGRDIQFGEGLARVTSRAEARTSYMVLMCHYLALSDERREGLVQVAVHENTGAVVDGFETLWPEFPAEFYTPGKVPSHFPLQLKQAVTAAMKRARLETEGELSDFFESMRRRLRRDVDNTREYYEALRNEMVAGLSHHHLTEGQRNERIDKIKTLPEEMNRKIHDLEQKYRVQVTVRACGALRFLVDVAHIMVEWKYRKLQRTMRLTWNPVTRSLDPLACEVCRETVHRVYPVERGAQFMAACYACSRKKA